MDRKRLLRNPLLWIVTACLLFFAVSTLLDDTRGYQPVSTSQALSQIDQGKVAEATIQDKEQRVLLTLKEGQPFEGNTKLTAQYPAGATDTVVSQISQHQVGNWNTQVNQDSIWTQLLIYLLPIGLLVLLLMWMMNNVQGGGNRVMNFGKSKAKQLTKDMPTSKFNDVAGADEAV